MVSIFKDGRLLLEFINPNYRGLVGWPCCDGWGDARTLVAVDACGHHTFSGRSEAFETTGFSLGIASFTPEDIPVGELCWVGHKDVKSKHDDTEVNHWYLSRFEGIKPGPIHGGPQVHSEGGCGEYVVPYLIAETAERAEELKDWHKC